MNEPSAGGYLAQLLQRSRGPVPGSVAPRGRSTFEDSPAAAQTEPVGQVDVTSGQGSAEISVAPGEIHSEAAVLAKPVTTAAAMVNEERSRQCAIEAKPRGPQNRITREPERRRESGRGTDPVSTPQPGLRSLDARDSVATNSEPAASDPAPDRKAANPRTITPRAVERDGTESDPGSAHGQSVPILLNRHAEPSDTGIEPAPVDAVATVPNLHGAKPAEPAEELATTRRAEVAPAAQSEPTSAIAVRTTPDAAPPRGQLEPIPSPPTAPVPSYVPDLAPTVQVNIGRIEVQAVSSPPRPAVRHERPVSRPRQPAMSLSAYLEKRGAESGKGRGK